MSPRIRGYNGSVIYDAGQSSPENSTDDRVVVISGSMINVYSTLHGVYFAYPRFISGSGAPPPSPPVASFTASLGLALSMSFTDTSTQSPTAWNWDFGDGTTSSTQSPTKIYATGGIYPVSLTASNAGGSSIATATVGAVDSEGPNAQFVPMTSASWHALSVHGLTIPAPDIQWNLQELTGTIVYPQPNSKIAPVALTEAANTSITYANSIAGWNRRWINFGTEVSNQRIAVTTGSLGALDAESYAVMVLMSPVTASATTRQSFTVTTQPAASSIVFTTTGIRGRFSNSNDTVATPGLFNDITTPHILIWWRDATGNTNGLTTDVVHVTGTFSETLMSGTAFGLGGSGVTAGKFAAGGIYVWKGSAAERDWKQVIKQLRWTVTY